ncbi:hypothetical protein QYE76_051998 [Lolium multiflorum]|uniref:TF-B3 domain-containing protein n=1 Tax=Lolium multiflorum TaxID=4521 RepID=A0AAD8SU43_LOLMU|nr:hypothetical protein QYE76_051998 [Lolium multiflorum]
MMDCKFFAIINYASSDKLSLPKKFADLLEGREPHELKVREVGIRRTSTWDMDVWFDGTGRMFLKRGWEYGSVKMELSDFEFYTTLQDAPSDKLMLPMKFAELLKGHEPRGLKLREADDPSSSPSDVDVLFNAAGCIYLGRGWKQFARIYCLQRGSLLLFSFDGEALLTVKVFKLDMCRRHYYYDHDASTSSETGPYPRTDEESTYEESMDGDDPSDSSIIVSRRADLDNDEKDHIRELLASKHEYIGVPYVTRLTRTNLARNEMTGEEIWRVKLHYEDDDRTKKVMAMTIDRTDICYIELISMIETVGFHGAFDYLYYRVKNAHGRAQLVPIEHASEVETMVSLLNKEKNIYLYVFKEKPNIDIVTPGSQSTDESVCTRKKSGYTVSVRDAISEDQDSNETEESDFSATNGAQELKENLALQCVKMTCAPLLNGLPMLAATARNYRTRNKETGDEPDCIALWEITHFKNGSWTTEESKKVYEKASEDIQNRETETGGPVSFEERINIFQAAYKESVKCKSSQPRGFGYMAKLPTKFEMIKYQVEEQSRATQKVNLELIQQVIELEQKLQDERDSMDEKINFERGQR